MMNALVINCSPVRRGATAEIVKIVSESLREKHTVRNICIDDYRFGFCKGCRSCHHTAKCIKKRLNQEWLRLSNPVKGYRMVFVCKYCCTDTGAPKNYANSWVLCDGYMLGNRSLSLCETFLKHFSLLFHNGKIAMLFGIMLTQIRHGRITHFFQIALQNTGDCFLKCFSTIAFTPPAKASLNNYFSNIGIWIGTSENRQFRLHVG